MSETASHSIRSGSHVIDLTGLGGHVRSPEPVHSRARVMHRTSGFVPLLCTDRGVDAGRWGDGCGRHPDIAPGAWGCAMAVISQQQLLDGSAVEVWCPLSNH